MIPKVKTCGKRFRRKLKNVNHWGRYVRNKHPLPVIWGLFSLKLEGHIRYYGVSYNLRAICIFRHQAMRIMFKHLNRRSQRRSFNWEQFNRYVKYHPLPKARICHKLF